MKSAIYYFIIFIFFVSCQNQSTDIREVKKSISDKKVSFLLQNSLSFFMPDTISYQFSCMQTAEKNRDIYVGMYSKEVRQFTLLSCNKKQIEYTIKFESEGINKLPPSVSQFKLKTPDSLIMINEYPPVLLIFDAEGHLSAKKRITGTLPNQIREFSMSGTYANTPLISDNLDTCVFSTYWQYGDFQAMYNSSFLAYYIFSKQKFNSLFGIFPSNYRQVVSKNQYYPWCEEPSLVKYGTKIIVSFPASDYLLFFNPDSLKDTYRIVARSKFAHKIQPISVEKQDFSRMTKFYTTNTLYSNFIFDKYRHLYYRIVKHKISLKNAEGRLNNWLQAKWSILIFDKNFNIAGEQEFPSRKYNFLYIFPTSKGLLINCNNKYNNYIKENEIKFDLFKVTIQR